MQKRKKYFSTRIETPADKAWRISVKKRDKWKCRKCGSKFKLNTHHIRKYSDHPSLRHSIDNGITLCFSCHKEMYSNEEAFERLCKLLIGNKKVIGEISFLLNEMRKADEKENL